MFFKKVEVNNYNLNIMETNKNRKNCFTICFCSDVTKEKITGYNLLSYLLTYATKNYSNQRSIILKNSSLYSPIIEIDILRYGNNIITKFIINYLNPKYLDEDNEIEVLDFFKEIIFNPLIIDNCFNEEYFNLCKKAYLSELKDALDDPKYSSNILMLEKMGSDNYTINSQGYIDILEKLTNKDIYEMYLDMLNNSHIEIMAIGMFNVDKIVNYFKNNFVFKNNLVLNDFRISHKEKKNEKEYIKETNYIQSKLAIACKVYDLTDIEYFYVGTLYNMILGSGPSSMLMKNIRDENNMVYYINSSFIKMDSLLVINSAFNYENKDSIIDETKNCMQEIINGNFSDEMFNRSKLEFISILNGALDSPYNIVNVMLGQILFNTPDLEERKEKVLSITRKDIQEFGKKINIDTIFVLRGE